MILLLYNRAAALLRGNLSGHPGGQERRTQAIAAMGPEDHRGHRSLSLPAMRSVAKGKMRKITYPHATYGLYRHTQDSAQPIDRLIDRDSTSPKSSHPMLLLPGRLEGGLRLREIDITLQVERREHRALCGGVAVQRFQQHGLAQGSTRPR